jgi:hypothetical protein
MNGIATLTIQGQQVLLKFGMPAVRRFFEKDLEYGFTKDGSYSDLAIAHILYAGYENGCMLKDEPKKLEFQAFYELAESFSMGDNNGEEIVAAITAFNDSRIIKRIAENAAKIKEEEEEKKSPTGTTLNRSFVENSVTSPENTIDSPGENIS